MVLYNRITELIAELKLLKKALLNVTLISQKRDTENIATNIASSEPLSIFCVKKQSDDCVGYFDLQCLSIECLLAKNQALSACLHRKDNLLHNALNDLKSTHEKLLIQDNKAIVGELTAGLVHEIKNLLNPIGFLDLIKDDLNPEHQEYIKYIYDSKNRIVELINDVRLLAKDEEVNYRISNHELNAVIKEAVYLSLLDNDVKNKTIDFDLNYQGKVQINKNKIIQVLLNLIRNAAHALNSIPAGKIIIRSQAENELVKVFVIDNGIGMEKEVLEKIWQPFFTTKGDSGTGVGLEICRNIIENHCGKIYCESQKNIGSLFCFSIWKSNDLITTPNLHLAL